MKIIEIDGRIYHFSGYGDDCDDDECKVVSSECLSEIFPGSSPWYSYIYLYVDVKYRGRYTKKDIIKIIEDYARARNLILEDVSVDIYLSESDCIWPCFKVEFSYTLFKPSYFHISFQSNSKCVYKKEYAYTDDNSVTLYRFYVKPARVTVFNRFCIRPYMPCFFGDEVLKKIKKILGG